MLRIIPLAVLLLAGGCKPRKKWIATRATQIHVAGLEADIPIGWRDYNELVEKPDVKVPDGMRMLVLDTEVGGATIIGGAERHTVSPDHCDDTAEAMKPQLPAGAVVSNVKRAQFRANPGCLMDLRVGQASGMVAIMVAANGRTVTIACMAGDGVSHVEDACYSIIDRLHPVP